MLRAPTRARVEPIGNSRKLMVTIFEFQMAIRIFKIIQNVNLFGENVFPYLGYA